MAERQVAREVEGSIKRGFCLHNEVRVGFPFVGTGKHRCCLPLCSPQPGADVNVQTVSASH